MSLMSSAATVCVVHSTGLCTDTRKLLSARNKTRTLGDLLMARQAGAALLLAAQPWLLPTKKWQSSEISPNVLPATPRMQRPSMLKLQYDRPGVRRHQTALLSVGPCGPGHTHRPMYCHQNCTTTLDPISVVRGGRHRTPPESGDLLLEITVFWSSQCGKLDPDATHALPDAERKMLASMSPCGVGYLAAVWVGIQNHPWAW